ncbi:unnamed protein product [Lasius platythorax]|uniref:Retrovirus-related Pol polyprotein from transposon TNT 1-94-like beta-barrel domain-containing protein n=1 Tax=Lasius platythorax TaxID=488582 RepID=A0AAV2MZW9_9HYME
MDINIADDLARKGKESMQNQQNALHASNNKPKFKGGHKADKGSKTATEKEVKPFKCHYCHKRGHKISQCWKKKNEEAACAEDAFYAINEDTHRKHIVNKGNVINAFNVKSEETDKWCLDSGTTSHMCKDRNRFVDLQKVINQKVRLANDKLTDIKEIGTVYLSLAEGTRTHRIKLENTLYVPELSTNLFSTSKATTNGRKILLTENAATILNQ